MFVNTALVSDPEVNLLLSILERIKTGKEESYMLLAGILVKVEIAIALIELALLAAKEIGWVVF